MELQIIIVKSPEYNGIVEAAAIAATEVACKMIRNWEDVFLDQEEAMKELKIGKTNHAKMKAMRDNGELIYKKNGRKFIYSRKSILEWMRK